MTELQTLMTTGVADMISALPTTATISGLAVQQTVGEVEALENSWLKQL